MEDYGNSFDLTLFAGEGRVGTLHYRLCSLGCKFPNALRNYRNRYYPSWGLPKTKKKVGANGSLAVFLEGVSRR